MPRTWGWVVDDEEEDVEGALAAASSRNLSMRSTMCGLEVCVSSGRCRPSSSASPHNPVRNSGIGSGTNTSLARVPPQYCSLRDVSAGGS